MKARGFARSERLTTLAGRPASIPARADAGVASVAIILQPVHGRTVVAHDGTIVYSPSAGYTGLDSFAYRSFDPTGPCEPVRVMVAVEALQREAARTTMPPPENDVITDLPGSRMPIRGSFEVVIWMVGGGI